VSTQQPATLAPFDKDLTAGAEMAPKLIPLTLTIERASKGCLQKPSPRMSEGVGSRSSSSTGKGWLTKMSAPA